MTTILICLIIISIAAFIIMGADKSRARSGAWRVPEKHLLLLALAGGAAGVLLGMKVFRHKTRHASFMILVPLLLGAQVLLLLWAGGYVDLPK